jgi:hypothetical protein
MAKTIDDAVVAVRTLARAISGIRSAPAGIPETTGEIYGFFVAWNGGGELNAADDSWERGLWTIICQLHFNRTELWQAEAYASPYARTVARALLADHTLTGTCDTFGRILISPLQPMNWGSSKTIGYEFRITDVKVIEARS